MGERTGPAALGNESTRRQVIVGVAVAFGGLAACWNVWASAQESMKEPASSAKDRTRTSLHQEIALKAIPQRIYDMLLDSKQFAAFSGMPATIDPKAGGAFSMFGGMIAGRNVELIPGQLIVQAWRPGSWNPGIYSIVRFGLKPQGSETLVVLDHTGFPQGDFASLDLGWKLHYWDRLKKYLGSHNR
jgi:activator of HSP90 ATPase